jgi:tetracycline 7-halogenase / FADH2 O2-dependent halogenase
LPWRGEDGDMKQTPKIYDVAILGTGMGGSILGAILARQGLGVVLIDKDAHPKFSIGESTVAETNLQMEIMAARYNVPELDNFRSFERSKSVLRTNGLKTNFGFIHHQPGEYPALADMNQVTITSAFHLFRQDVDTYLYQVAIS